MVKYNYHQNGGKHGPYYEIQILKMIENGVVQADAMLENLDSGYKFGIEDVILQMERDKKNAKKTARVMVEDFNMRFGSMVTMMFQWAIASIPAFILLALLFGFAAVFFSAFIAAMNSAG